MTDQHEYGIIAVRTQADTAHPLPGGGYPLKITGCDMETGAEVTITSHGDIRAICDMLDHLRLWWVPAAIGHIDADQAMGGPEVSGR